MKALPEDDPRSFTQQANIHYAYCNTVYNQRNSTELFQVHQSWLLFPFHRWYIYFHERILAKLLDDDTFALPFWNYDHPDGSSIPSMYVDLPVLVDSKRDGAHLPPAVVAIDYNYNQEARSREDQITENLNQVHRVLIRDADTQDQFFGRPYRHGDGTMPGGGIVEDMPHGTLHVWGGSNHEVGGKDLGSFYAAARDPLSYAHRAQLDRMWELWKRISPDRHTDISDADFLDSEMEFYNEDAELVRVRMADSLSTEKLGYAFEDVELPWLDAEPVRISDGPASLSVDDSVCELGSGKPLAQVCSVVVQRSEFAIGVAYVEEILVMYGVEWTEGLPVKMQVYLNLPSANVNTTAGCHEYVGMYVIVPQFHEGENSIF